VKIQPQWVVTPGKQTNKQTKTQADDGLLEAERVRVVGFFLPLKYKLSSTDKVVGFTVYDTNG
jgi:hypothetical protein